MDGFGAMGFPHCIGATDASHVPIRAPWRKIHELGNRKIFCSVLLQVVTTHHGIFLDAEVGFSGKTHDAFIFAHSNICALMDVCVGYFPSNPIITLHW